MYKKISRVLGALIAIALWVYALLLLIHAVGLPSYRETSILTILALCGIYTLFAKNP